MQMDVIQLQNVISHQYIIIIEALLKYILLVTYTYFMILHRETYEKHYGQWSSLVRW